MPLSAWRQLSHEPVEKLIEYAEGLTLPVAWRYAAAKLLSLTVEPRLEVFNPAMIEIDGGRVEVGLLESGVYAVMNNFWGLGLNRNWNAKEVPRHQVHLNLYAIGKYPVTNFEYRTFLEANHHVCIPENWEFGQFPYERANHPVYGIKPEDATLYAAWLSDVCGKAFRLPTEAEWKYAAAGPESLEFPWGSTFKPGHANTAEMGLFGTTPVGMLGEGASPFGCFDMAGNVEEYVADDYAPFPGGKAISDDLSTVVGNHRIARGGSFARFRDLARNCRRHGKYPCPIYVMGYRLAQTLASNKYGMKEVCTTSLGRT